MVGNVADGPTSRVSIRGLWYVVASATPAKPRLVDPQIFFVWHASPKLLRAEASVAAQFAAKVRLVRIASFGRDACPVHTRLRGVRSQQQSVFRSCKPPQRALRTNRSWCAFVVQVGVCSALWKICALAIWRPETTRRVSGPAPKMPLDCSIGRRANAVLGTSRFAPRGLHRSTREAHRAPWLATNRPALPRVDIRGSGGGPHRPESATKAHLRRGAG